MAHSLYITEIEWLDRPYFRLAKRTPDGTEHLVASGWRSREEAEAALPIWQAIEDRPIEARESFAAWGPRLRGLRTHATKPHQYRVYHQFWVQDEHTGAKDEVRVWRESDGTAKGHTDLTGFLTPDEAEPFLLQRGELDAADPYVQGYLRSKLPCDQRGYHRDDDSGARVLPEQIGSLILGYCLDCKLDLYPERTEFSRQSREIRRQYEAHQEGQFLAGKEQGQ
jgi:hypothetical protein